MSGDNFVKPICEQDQLDLCTSLARSAEAELKILPVATFSVCVSTAWSAYREFCRRSYPGLIGMSTHLWPTLHLARGCAKAWWGVSRWNEKESICVWSIGPDIPDVRLDICWVIITGAEPSIIQILAVHQHQNIGTSAGKGFDWDVTAFLQFSPSHCRKVAPNQILTRWIMTKILIAAPRSYFSISTPTKQHRVPNDLLYV